MKFAPEYVTHVLNEVFEDAKTLLLTPLMAINDAHLVMLAEQKIVSPADARTLREMLMGSRIIEGGGCGFNPKAPRNTIYPAGSNSPGALHFGVDLPKPSDYIRKVMPKDRKSTRLNSSHT